MVDALFKLSDSSRIGRLHAMLLVLFMAGLGVFAQTPLSHGKATELVIARYENLIADGALLTPDGWRRAAKLFDQSNAYPQDGVIFLTSTGGALGEMWLKGDRAQVETKWTDYDGSIDSTLRYKPPEGGHVETESRLFRRESAELNSFLPSLLRMASTSKRAALATSRMS
jgi:hypothetical protein